MNDARIQGRIFPSVAGMRLLSNSIYRIVEKCYPPSMDDFVERRFLEITAGDRKLKPEQEELFKKIEPGESRVPNIKYQNRIEELFQFLANERVQLWNKDIEQKKYCLEHAMAELNCLRAEIVDLKTQITNSERWLAGWYIGSVLLYSKDIIPHLWILLLPLLISGFGFIRFREYQRNVFDLDCYLRELEQAVRPDKGWVNYFFKTRQMARFFETRTYFWYGAIVTSVIIIILGIAGEQGHTMGITPLPFSVEISSS